MPSIVQLQNAILAAGYPIGKADGIVGPKTRDGAQRLADALEVLYRSGTAPAAEPEQSWSALVQPAWMPDCAMKGVIVHWTAGGSKASADDRKHYHILIEDDGTLVRGIPSIKDNAAPKTAAYAAHTLNCNTGFIGVALCGMRGAVERPFDAGPSPLTARQWDVLKRTVATLCRRYSIPVTPRTVLSHAEVQVTLGIKQKGKWDIARLPFNPSLVGAKAVGDDLRAAVSALI